MFDMKEAENYIDLIMSKCYRTSYDEIKDKNALKRLTDFQLELIKGQYNDFNISNITKMQTNRTVDISIQILKFMLDSNIQHEKIDRIPSMIATKGGTNPHEGSFCEIASSPFLMLETIGYLESIPTIIHESTHYLTPSISTPNFHNTEILPIALELIGTDMLDELKLKRELLIFESLESRLYHLKKRLIEKIKIAEAIENCKRIEDLNELKLLLEAKSHLLYTYLTSFIYAYGIYQEYISTGDRVLYGLTDSLDNSELVMNIVNKYDLDLNKSKSIEEAHKLLKRF